MALPEISTGYKPEFGLGALYQGFNAGNADMSAQEELLKQFLANQREQQMQPLDVNIRQTESDRATVGRGQDMLDAYRRGYIGQNNSQDAAGQKALGTLNSEMALTNAANRNKLTVEQLLKRLNDLKQTKIEGGGEIGFPVQAPQTQQGGGGFSWQVPPEVQQERDQGRIGILRQEKQLYPNDPNLARELQLAEANIDKTPSTPQAVNANNSVLQQFAPKRNGGITQGGPEYEAVMQALVDTPELRSKLLQGDQKLDSTEYLRMAALAQAEKLAAAKKTGSGKDPYIEFNKLSPDKRLGIMEWAITGGINPVTREPLREEERAQWTALYNQDLATYNARNAANAKEGSVNISTMTEGAVPTREAPSAGTPKTVGGDIKQQVEASGISYEPSKYDYRVVDGKVQRKLKGK